VYRRHNIQVAFDGKTITQKTNITFSLFTVMISFIPQPLYPWGQMVLLYPLDRRLVERYGEEVEAFALASR
jgi:hypothetical protein